MGKSSRFLQTCPLTTQTYTNYAQEWGVTTKVQYQKEKESVLFIIANIPWLKRSRISLNLNHNLLSASMTTREGKIMPIIVEIEIMLLFKNTNMLFLMIRTKKAHWDDPPKPRDMNI